MSGLIIIDFIDMLSYGNRRLVERKLKEALPTLKPTTEAVAVHIAELRKEFRQFVSSDAALPIKTRPGGGGYSWLEE